MDSGVELYISAFENGSVIEISEWVSLSFSEEIEFRYEPKLLSAVIRGIKEPLILLEITVMIYFLLAGHS